MKKKTCPHCGNDSYSAAAESELACQHCGKGHHRREERAREVGADSHGLCARPSLPSCVLNYWQCRYQPQS